jgi:hypothetical protein
VADAGTLMTTERDSHATPERQRTSRTGRTLPDGPIKAPVSTTAGLVLQLQRAAGNLAVARALQRTKAAGAAAVPTAVQLEAAAASGATPAGPQLAAVWNAQVVVPLARAADRVGRATPDYKGAKSDLEAALRTVGMLRDATPTKDRNRLRFEIIERRARGVLEIVNQHLGVGRTDRQLDTDTIKIRVEATELGPKLEHRPGPEAADIVRGRDAAAGSGPVASAEPGAGATQPPAPAPAAAAAPTAAPDGADTSAAKGDDSIEDLWNFLVVQRLWSAQKQLSEDPKFAILDYNNARLYILLFLQATPEGHPNRLPLISLDAGVEAIAGQMATRSPDFVSTDPLDDQAIAAHDTAEAMVEFIPGAPQQAASGQPAGGATGASDGASGGSKEPDFTWERAPAPRSDDTALERP